MRRSLVGSKGNRLVVLAYHNVEGTWRWPMKAGNGVAALTRQLRFLRRTTTVVPLEESLRALADGRPLPPRAVALTFDDGYRDNLTLAAPVLRRLGLPATVYLVPGFLTGEVHAWWERLGWAIRLARVPFFEFDGRQFALSEPQDRITALDAVEAGLKKRDHDARHAGVEALVEVLDPAGGYHPDELFLDWDGARGLVDAGISIGSHTMRHAILAREAAESQRADLRESRRLLQERLDIPVDTLAYPNGGRDDYDEATIAAAREGGYSHAVTTWGASSSAATPAYEIRRKMAGTDRRAARLTAGVLRDLVS